MVTDVLDDSMLPAFFLCSILVKRLIETTTLQLFPTSVTKLFHDFVDEWEKIHAAKFQNQEWQEAFIALFM